MGDLVADPVDEGLCVAVTVSVAVTEAVGVEDRLWVRVSVLVEVGVRVGTGVRVPVDERLRVGVAVYVGGFSIARDATGLSIQRRRQATARIAAPSMAPVLVNGLRYRAPTTQFAFVAVHCGRRPSIV